MKLFKAIACLAVIVLAFGLAACGGDDDDATTTATTTEATTNGGNGETDTTAEAGGEATTLEISADPGGALAYTETELSVPAGTVDIEFTNESPVPHDVVVNDPAGDEVGRTDVVTNDNASTTLDNLEPGEYQFYCSVPGHLEAGMEGVLTVE